MIELDSLAQLDLAEFVRPGDAIVIGQGTGEPRGLTRRLVDQRAQFTGVVLLLVSPPNAQGEYSLGLVNDYLRTAMVRARVVIAEVSSHVPWTHCDRPLRREDISVAVHSETLPLEVPTARFGDLERCLASHVDDFTGDGATLQVGIGAIPEAILARLGDRQDLGIHSGTIGDSVVDLIEKRAVTNARKSIDPGVTITGVLFGTQRLFSFAHANPTLRRCPSSYTHHIARLSRLRRLVSINAALQVDLTGQVNAEAIGCNYIGAVGGQVDFVRTAVLTGGASVIALAANGRGGDSKIVPALSGPVTTARSDVDVVVTEHGAARLRGQSMRERIRSMTAIAAPEHRDALRSQARDVWGEA